MANTAKKSEKYVQQQKKKLANDPSAMSDYALATQQVLSKGGNSVSNMSIIVKM